MDHVLLMVWHALLVAVFFAFLWRRTMDERRRLFVKTLLIMVIGAVILGWAMYFAPP